jgi:hypothetical protein
MGVGSGHGKAIRVREGFARERFSLGITELACDFRPVELGQNKNVQLKLTR